MSDIDEKDEALRRLRVTCIHCHNTGSVLRITASKGEQVVEELPCHGCEFGRNMQISGWWRATGLQAWPYDS